jgi:transaldolase/glucose-6-phosphate isomerase
VSGELKLPFAAQIGRASDLAAISSTLERARSEEWATRLADKDVTLWSSDAAVQTSIANRLGWLDAPSHFTTQAPALEAFGEKVRDEGFTTAIVAGMGGSSLAPEVLATAFAEISDWLKIRVCDSTDPEAVAAALAGLNPAKTLVIVASKSGTTTETLSFAAYAAGWIKGSLSEGADPYASMIAISDPSPCIDGIPGSEQMLERFLNPADIGGRYSALSFVGLVPASLLGVDLDSLLAAGAVAAAQLREPEPTANRAVALGAIIGALAREGRDKLTLIVDQPIHGFGAWAEQLVAESTGKRGVGVVPVDLEPLGTGTSYQDDRLFVRIALRDGHAPRAADGSSVDARLSELAAAGHPVISYTLADPIDLGGEFVHWEAATAIAGVVLGINPFDEPNVTESKQNTTKVLGELAATGRLPELTPTCTDGSLQLWVDDALPAAFSDSAETLIAGQLQRLAERGYVGIHAYIAPTPERTAALTSLRILLRDATRRATTVGYGPRFLHSTGQLHKGGAPIGWFIQLVAGRPHDLDIPGSSFTFGQLIDAQALGDARSLVAHELPVMRIHLGSNPDAGLAALESLFRRALSA